MFEGCHVNQELRRFSSAKKLSIFMRWKSENRYGREISPQERVRREPLIATTIKLRLPKFPNGDFILRRCESVPTSAWFDIAVIAQEDAKVLQQAALQKADW